MMGAKNHSSFRVLGARDLANDIGGRFLREKRVDRLPKQDLLRKKEEKSAYNEDSG